MRDDSYHEAEVLKGTAGTFALNFGSLEAAYPLFTSRRSASFESGCGQPVISFLFCCFQFNAATKIMSEMPKAVPRGKKKTNVFY